MRKFTSKEITKHIREEVARKVPRDEEKIREAQKLDRFHTDWLAHATWKQVEERISGLELLPGSPEYEQIRALWREYQQELQSRIRRR